MGPKVVPGDSPHRDSHPPFYEGNHWDYYFSLLPIFVPLSLCAIPNAYSLRDPILNPKVLYSLFGVYQTFESTHFFGKVRGN